MDPEEVEYFGENQLISIIPNFTSDTLHMISGDVGPFRAALPVRVPLWLGVNLKVQQKCIIQPPDWMDVDILEGIKEAEKNSRGFVKMPSEHYMVEAKLLLGCASDDIPRADEVRTIIKDIWDMRMSKLRSAMDLLVRNATMFSSADNLTVMEINSVRPALPHAMDQLNRIRKAIQTSQGSQIQSSSSLNNSSSLLSSSHSRSLNISR